MSSRSAETVGPKIETAPSGGNETILVVEDDTVIRTLGTRILTKAGYTVLGACDGIEALELLASGAEVDLIVSDVVMPRLGGLELYARLKERGNPPPLLLASGYGASGVDPEMLSEKGVAIVRKPYSPDELLRKIRGLLDN
jgi:two-component system cell cycle sensor histidine kinase/response regulator CckA